MDSKLGLRSDEEQKRNFPYQQAAGAHRSTFDKEKGLGLVGCSDYDYARDEEGRRSVPREVVIGAVAYVS